MTAILLVKTSSLGDVVHNLPVLSDIRRALPQADVDWMVEESFAAIPRLHPALRSVVPVGVRRWRKTWWRSDTRAEAAAWRRSLRDRTYDAVIDTQGLVKSAILTRAARGLRYGPDWASAREPLARLLYDRALPVPRGRHAVERNRELAALALGYALPAQVDYGIAAAAGAAAEGPVVLLHATSAREKLWPERQWIALARELQSRAASFVLPWGNADERMRSETLAAGIPNGIVPEAMPVAQVAQLISRAQLVVGLDTGLTHLAGALGVPTVGLYVATEPAATGLYGCPRAVNVGGVARAPTVEGVLAAIARVAPWR